MIEIIPFLPFLVKKQVPVQEKIIINIVNQSSYDIDYIFGEITGTVIKNQTAEIETLDTTSKITIINPTTENINVEISGKNINETYTSIRYQESLANINEDVVITIVDFVEDVQKPKININNNSSYDIDYIFGEMTGTVIKNQTAVLEIIESLKITIDNPTDELINIEILGENINETDTQSNNYESLAIINEDVVITIVDYVEQGGN